MADAPRSPSDPRPASDPLPQYLTVDEFGRLMRLGRSKAYDAVRNGEVPHLRFGKIIRIPRSALAVSPTEAA